MPLPKLPPDRRPPRAHWPKRRSSWDVLPPPSPDKISRALVDDLLAAEEFDDAAVTALAHRDSYAAAASHLLRIVDGGWDLVAVLIELHSPHAPHRLAVRFGVIDPDARLYHVFTVVDLRAIDSPAASLALIALQSEDRDWTALDRKGRAIFVLCRVVQAMRANTI